MDAHRWRRGLCFGDGDNLLSLFFLFFGLNFILERYEVPAVVDETLVHVGYAIGVVEGGFEEDWEFVLTSESFVFGIIYYVYALNVKEMWSRTCFNVFKIRLRPKSNSIGHEEVIHDWIIQLLHNLILMKQIDGQLILLPSVRLRIVHVQDMPDELLVLVTNGHLEMNSKFARIRRRPHSDSNSIEHIKFLLDKISVLPAAKHVVMHHMERLSFFHELS